MSILIDVKEQGIVAKLFLPESNEARPAIVILGGSNGGFYEPVAQILADKGYVTLALAYFNAPGTPKHLENIPLEYFLHAIRWLKSQPQVKPEQVHLYGVSRGGELAILLASVFQNEIASVVAIVPSCVTYGGIPNEKKPSWTFDNQPLPIAPSPDRDDELKQLQTQESVNLTSLFLEKIQRNKAAFDAAMIKVENIRCPLLIVSGKDDKMWPSSLYGNLIMQRLDAYQSSIFRKHLSYENAGHMILHEFAPIMIEPLRHPVTGLKYEIGGNPSAQAKANKDSWKQILDFFAQFSQ